MDAELKMKAKLILAFMAFATFTYADPHTAYKAGYKDAMSYWRRGVRITDPIDIEGAGEGRATRNRYNGGPDRDAFIRGWMVASLILLQKHSEK